MFEVLTKQFTGPLDLLLQLVEEQKLEIANVSLAQVTEQFVEQLEIVKEKEPELIPDFLSIAARLIVLKSRELLPDFEDDEEDDIEKQLKIYKEFLEASKMIMKIVAAGNFSFGRERPLRPLEIKFLAPTNATPDPLNAAFCAALQKVAPRWALPKMFIDKEITMQEQIDLLRDLVQKQKKLDFHKAFVSAKSKTEIIVNFLAALELLKAKIIDAKQTRNFSSIIIQKT
ncbi:segregation/condensation protein A [Candidatus Falkowbacteria bacterium]|nr:segregation/condensation protein A [Candidatus Falkowbacteria bacterium]